MLCILFLFSLIVDCNWLDLDKVSLKLASKNLVRSKLINVLKYFLFHFKEKDFHNIWIAASGKYKKCSQHANFTL